MCFLLLLKIESLSRTTNCSLFQCAMNSVIYLNLKSDNERAKKFYEKNGMKLIDKTSWTDGDVEVDVYQKILKKMDIEELELNIDSD